MFMVFCACFPKMRKDAQYTSTISDNVRFFIVGISWYWILKCTCSFPLYNIYIAFNII